MEARQRRIRRISPELQTVARDLRREMTRAEAVLWEALRGRRLAGLKFRRQHAIGTSVLDFCCPTARLVIEVDGGVHEADEVAAHDRARDEQFTAAGYTVLRVRNEDVFRDLPGVLDRIAATAMKNRAPVCEFAGPATNRDLENHPSVEAPPLPGLGEGAGG
jgi:very-short-patch-repair endonuclease